jgi:hypothetical protein
MRQCVLAKNFKELNVLQWKLEINRFFASFLIEQIISKLISLAYNFILFSFKKAWHLCESSFFSW